MSALDPATWMHDLVNVLSCADRDCSRAKADSS